MSPPDKTSNMRVTIMRARYVAGSYFSAAVITFSRCAKIAVLVIRDLRLQRLVLAKNSLT
jgi:hypothetical protein